MSYVVTGLPVEEFRPLFGLLDAELAARGIRRMTADEPVGFPCRVTLEDAPVGETLLLLNYEHQPADTPYRSRHAIFVRETAMETRSFVGEVPPALRARAYISLRAFDGAGNIVGSEIAPGADLEPAIARLLGLPDTAYLHAHNAGHGCYAARIDRG
jgi:hypothetical protein